MRVASFTSSLVKYCFLPCCKITLLTFKCGLAQKSFALSFDMCSCRHLNWQLYSGILVYANRYKLYNFWFQNTIAITFSAENATLNWLIVMNPVTILLKKWYVMQLEKVFSSNTLCSFIVCQHSGNPFCTDILIVKRLH